MSSADADLVRATVDRLVAEALGLSTAQVAALPDATPMFGAPLELGSLTGARLLDAVKGELGVDIAADDLHLSALDSLGSLRGYVVTELTGR